MEIDDIINYHDVVTAENQGAQAASLLVSAASRSELCWLSALADSPYNARRWQISGQSRSLISIGIDFWVSVVRRMK